MKSSNLREFFKERKQNGKNFDYFNTIIEVNN